MNEYKIDCAIPRGWLLETRQDFARRFNIVDLTDDKFYERFITIISSIVKDDDRFFKLSYEIHLIVGKEITEQEDKWLYGLFNHTKLYKILQSLVERKMFIDFLNLIEHIVNFYYKDKDDSILSAFNDIARISNLNVRLCYDDKYRFYPSGVELFDKKLVDDVLEFLQPYKDAHKELTEALQEFIQKKYREAVDKTRLALEVFFKKLLKNNKSLENQKECLNQYLGEYIHQDIKSMFLQILDFYAKFNNDKAKHNSGDFKEYEVEFLFYLVGNFIRLFMQVEKDKMAK